MKTSEIQIGTLYAVGEGQSRTRQRGIVLSIEPHRMTTGYSTHYTTSLHPDPTGRGYGGRRSTGERGLPVLLTYQPFYGHDEKRAATDDELHELAQRLIADGFTGDGLIEDRVAFPDHQARLEVVRPQAIERLWADHQESVRRAKEASEVESQRRERVRRLAQVEHQRTLDLLTELGIDYRPPVSRDGGGDRQTVVGQMSWQALANLIAEVADAATEPWRDVADTIVGEVFDDDSPHMVSAENLTRLRELLGPTKFGQAYTTEGER